jgi:predicted DNA-binding transcriptional regulator AlpA
MTEELWTGRKVAQVLGVSSQTVKNWRVNQRVQLPFVRVGGAVRYRPSDISAFVESKVVVPQPRNQA